MKIVLTTGLISRNRGRNSILRLEHPPLGLSYIASVLENKGHETVIYDCLPRSYYIEDVVTEILSKKPDIIGISVMSTNYDGAQGMSSLIKKMANIPIVFGGPHCSSFPMQTVEDCPDVDFLIYGEGEFVFARLIEAISERKSYYDIPQLCFRDSGNGVILNRQEELIEDLDTIPFPTRDLFDRNLYSFDTTAFITSRGCPYGKCTFCMRTGLLYEKYRRRSVENILDEVEFLYKKSPFKKALFVDDNFAQGEEWVIRFCDALIQRRLKFRWICSARVDTITRKMIKKMAEAGCTLIRYGIESGNQDLLDCIKKGITIQQVKEAIKITKESRIRALGSFMLALPGESPEMGKRTIRFAVDLGLDFAQFLTARPLFGTKMYELCKKEGKLLDRSYESHDHDNSTLSVLLIPKIKFVPRSYKDQEAVAQMIKSAYRKFYFRFGYICVLLKNRKNWHDLFRLCKLLWVFRKAISYVIQ